MTSPQRPAATIAVVTFVVLVLEITSTRLYAYIGSSHATSTALSIALLGLGIGAFVRARWLLLDLRSVRGTWLGGERVVGERAIAPGQRITMGPFQLVIE